MLSPHSVIVLFQLRSVGTDVGETSSGAVVETAVCADVGAGIVGVDAVEDVGGVARVVVGEVGIDCCGLVGRCVEVVAEAAEPEVSSMIRKVRWLVVLTQR